MTRPKNQRFHGQVVVWLRERKKIGASVFGMNAIGNLNLCIQPFGLNMRPHLWDSWTSHSVSE